MGLALKYDYGQTPIETNELNDLKINSISTQSELNELEQQNVEKAIAWSLKRRFSDKEILSEDFIKQVHRKMFDEVWVWAGKFRLTQKNIGVNHYLIPVELRTLIEDCIFWKNNNTFLADELAIRFKHRLVSIHPFPNGNGRHSRLMADIIISHIFKKPVFTWGLKNLNTSANQRQHYIHSLKQADKGNCNQLLQFARS